MGNGREDVTLHISSGSVVKTIVIILLFVALFVLRDLILVVLAAIVVASAIEPITRWCMEHRIPRLPATLLIYCACGIILVGLFYFLFLPLLGETSSFFASLPSYVDQGSVSMQQSGFFESNSLFGHLSSSFSLETIAREGSKILSILGGTGFWNTISAVSGGLLSLVLIIVLSFYLAVQEDGVGKFLRIITPRKREAYVVGLWKRARVKIGLWMQGQLLLAVFIAVLVYLGLAVFGVKHALLLAVLAGVFELIPLFGPILAAIPAILVGFVDGGFSMAILIAGFYLIIQQFENQLIYPLVVKKVVGVPPIIVIIALIAGAQLGGILGMLLSVPVAAVIMEFINDLEHEKPHAE